MPWRSYKIMQACWIAPLAWRDLPSSTCFTLMTCSQLVLMSRDPCELQRMLDALSEASRILSICIQVNISKIEVMILSVSGMQATAGRRLHVWVNLRAGHIVPSAKYLGMWLTSDGKQGCMQGLLQMLQRGLRTCCVVL